MKHINQWFQNSSEKVFKRFTVIIPQVENEISASKLPIFDINQNVSPKKYFYSKTD